MACEGGSSGLVYAANELGEVAEWPKAHAWKVCNGQLFEGSTPSLTAIIPDEKLLILAAKEYSASQIHHFLSSTKLLESGIQLWWLYRFPRNEKQ